jgi:hypothetical protein
MVILRSSAGCPVCIDMGPLQKAECMLWHFSFVVLISSSQSELQSGVFLHRLIFIDEFSFAWIDMDVCLGLPFIGCDHLA